MSEHGMNAQGDGFITPTARSRVRGGDTAVQSLGADILDSDLDGAGRRAASWNRESIYTEGFAHANPVPAACRVGPFLFSGVITGRGPGRTLSANKDEQTAQVFQHVREVVGAGGGTVGDIAKMTFWLDDLGDREALNREWVAMFPDPNDRPTRHALAGNLEPGKLIECDFIAVLMN